MEFDGAGVFLLVAGVCLVLGAGAGVFLFGAGACVCKGDTGGAGGVEGRLDRMRLNTVLGGVAVVMCLAIGSAMCLSLG